MQLIGLCQLKSSRRINGNTPFCLQAICNFHRNNCKGENERAEDRRKDGKEELCTVKTEESGRYVRKNGKRNDNRMKIV